MSRIGLMPSHHLLYYDTPWHMVHVAVEPAVTGSYRMPLNVRIISIIAQYSHNALLPPTVIIPIGIAQRRSRSWLPPKALSKAYHAT